MIRLFKKILFIELILINIFIFSFEVQGNISTNAKNGSILPDSLTGEVLFD